MPIDSPLFTPLTLPNGAVLTNRLCKAAMEENLCEPGQLPGPRLETLYRQWAQGGAGVLITGNVMVTPNAMTGPGGVVLDRDQDLAPFERWAQAGTPKDGGHLWMQINHPGRQVYAALGEQAVSASDVAIDIPGFSKLFARPRALSEVEIEEIIGRFAHTARLADQAGFTGVQIHAAHGYLLSQFLSPLTNRRSDRWGGSLENRSRMLLDVVRAVREAVRPEFCVTVKLNSADFQKGGFELDDAITVVEALNDTKVDLVELSGGSYESPAMQGTASDDSTGQREAYFVDFARQVARVATMPIMVTGGVRRWAVAEAAMSRDEAGFGVDLLGVARALAFQPDLVARWREGEQLDVEIPRVAWKNKTLASLAGMAVTKAQLGRLARGEQPKPGVSPLWAVLSDQLATKLRTRRYRRWRRATKT